MSFMAVTSAASAAVAPAGFLPWGKQTAQYIDSEEGLIYCRQYHHNHQSYQLLFLKQVVSQEVWFKKHSQDFSSLRMTNLVFLVFTVLLQCVTACLYTRQNKSILCCFAQLKAKKNHLHIAQALWVEFFPVEFTSTRTKVTVNIKCRVGGSFHVHTLGTDPSWPHSGNGSGSGSALPSFLRSSTFILENKVIWYCKRYFYSMLKQSFLRSLFLPYAFWPSTSSLVQCSFKCSKLTVAREVGRFVDACEVHTYHRISCDCSGLVLLNMVASSITPVKQHAEAVSDLAATWALVH